MNKITSIHLNGKSFNLEEAGYEALRYYLDDARRKLAADPDVEDVIADLEQAIADKCSALLHRDKDVVTTTEITTMLTEMGPVEAEADRAANTSTAPNDDQAQAGQSSSASSTPKRLYIIPDGAVIAGVCKGMSAYTGIEVNLMRFLFAALVFFTGGTMILIYFLMAIFLPRATTPAQIAEAYGRPVTAQEIIEQGKGRLEQISKNLRETDTEKLNRIVYFIIIVVVLVGLVAILKAISWF